jgi:hypothetical protein
MSATLIIAKADEHLAPRLVSALVLCWDVVPLATQGQLLHEAAFMANGSPNAITSPAERKAPDDMIGAA